MRYGLLASCVAHASLWQFAAHSYAPPLRAAATQVEIELAQPPAPAPPPPSAAVAPASDSSRPRRAKAARPRAVAAAAAASPQPAAVAVPAADAPADLTSDTLVVARAAAAPLPGSRAAPGAPVAAQAGTSDLSNAVALEEANWSCPWPRDAAAELIDTQLVVIRVVVSAAGAVESAALLADPGRGFGSAAIACALRTRFTPARDREGRPVRAQSPPIRVTFSR
jgi:protein TonB